MFKAMEAFFKCLRATESVRGTKLVDLGIMNKGSLEEAGIVCILSSFLWSTLWSAHIFYHFVCIDYQ